jgi:hypothetical protein
VKFWRTHFEGWLVLAVALGCLVFQLWIPFTHVADSDYENAAQVLLAQAQPGDMVLLQPWWTERARLFLPENVPVVGFQGCQTRDFEKYRRIWVLAQPAQPRAQMGAFSESFGRQRTVLQGPQRFGRLELSLYENGRFQAPVFSGFQALSEVKKEWHEVLFEPVQCIRFDPPNSLEFVMPVSTQNLRVQAGYIWDRGAFKEGVTGSVIDISKNGKQMQLGLPAGVEGFQILSLGAVSSGTSIKLSISAGNLNAREVCLVLDGLGSAP